MKSELLVSILIPVYNRETLINEAVYSALSQTYENIEVVVVDNKSTDKTWEVLMAIAGRDSRVKIFQNNENLGPVLNWAAGLKKCKGKYVKILWSDDLISEDFIEKTLPLFDDNTAFVITGVEYFGDKVLYSKFQNIFPSVLPSSLYLSENILSSNQAEFQISPGCGIFRNTDLIDNLLIDIPNTFDLDFKKYGAGNDLMIFMLTALRYKYIKIVPEYLSKFRFHEDSFSVKNNLEKYYDLAKYHFVTEYKKDFMPLFVINQYYKRKSSDFHKEFWEVIKVNFSMIYFLKHRFEILKYNILGK